jgi:hypothetical protein
MRVQKGGGVMKTKAQKLREDADRAYRALLRAQRDVENAKICLKYAQQRHTEADAAATKAELEESLGATPSNERGSDD